MVSRFRDVFTTLRTEGLLLPPDLLARVSPGCGDLDGLDERDYHLIKGERLNEAINRSWNRLVGVWAAFRGVAEKLPPGDAATTLTRDRWLLPLFGELGYGRLPSQRSSLVADGREYPVSHLWGHAPIHLIGAGVDLDARTAGVRGAAHTTPHGLVQELLNRSDDHLWGFVSNGRKLRILRDNSRLTRQAYVEFDLEAMMNGEVYTDFALLWLLCHQSRVESDRPEECWLETWSREAQERGVRALDGLREGVEQAIIALGGGFLTPPTNRELKEKLRSGRLDTRQYYRQILRLVYRLIFLFVAEDRGLLLDPGAGEEAKERYTRYYSTAHLRELASRRRGTRHSDLFQGLRLVMEKLGSDDGCPELGLPALGSFLFSRRALPDLEYAELPNGPMLEAVRALSGIVEGGIRRTVDYKNLGAEELGSVYESLLELHPVMNVDVGTFHLDSVSGNERKSTGSYYTPESLVRNLLGTALDPVLNAAARSSDPVAAILRLKVCDPACGSGHFLIAAAHRIAKRLASVRTGDDEPSPAATRTALREVIGKCIYGVDLNPMAVELCKVSLWMEALEPGKPLSFLDHHIQVGNSLLGATPALLRRGIPNEAFITIEGDDRTYCSEYRRKNRQFRNRPQEKLWDKTGDPWNAIGNLGESVLHIDEVVDEEIPGVHRKEEMWEELVGSSGYQFVRLLNDAWCAAFVWKKRTDETLLYPITEEEFRKVRRNPLACPPWMETEVRRLAEQYGFFHWHLAFPSVFCPVAETATETTPDDPAGWEGGFDVVLGNPPWERIKLQEQEWFAARRPDISEASNAAQRRRMIRALEEEDPALYAAFLDDRRRSEGESHLVRDTGRYPLCGRGDVNTYALFAETNRLIQNPRGRVGCVLPTGIATDDTTKFFFQHLVESRSLASLYSFENEEHLFPAVHHATKFCLLTVSGRECPQDAAELVFFARQADDLADPSRRFTLSREDFELINPNTRTCPTFRSSRDAEITKSIYRSVPVVIREDREDRNPWAIRFMAMFHMANDSELFRERDQLVQEGGTLNGNRFAVGEDIYFPLYEAKMIHHFDHRFGTYEGQTESQANQGKLPEATVAQHADTSFVTQPRYWVDRAKVVARTADVPDGFITAHRANRTDHIQQMMSYWLAGYCLNRGLDGMGNDILDRLISRDPGRLLTESAAAITFDRLDAEGRVRKLENNFPLTPADLEIIETHAEDFLTMAGELIELRTPRWLLGWRDICRSTDERTLISTIVPQVACGDTLLLLFPKVGDASKSALLPACLNSFVVDYAARQKVGGTHLKYHVFKQLPVPAPDAFDAPAPWDSSVSLRDWFFPRVLELTYTAADIQPFATGCGYDGPPFRWEDSRRFLLRCEIDAAFFHLYCVGRDDTDYILETFPIVKRKDIGRHGEYRTKQVILEIFDTMADSVRTGIPYDTRLDPPPADCRVTHGAA